MVHGTFVSIVAYCALVSSSLAASAISPLRARVDRAAGDGSRKILICHIPQRNPAAFESITVSARSLRDHLLHGDSLGPCSFNCKLFPAVCNDGDACTVDVCDPVTQHCGAPTRIGCDDDDACTIDFCRGGDCKHEAVVCDPGPDNHEEGLCRQVGCDKTLGCVTLEVDCGDSCKQCNPATGDCERVDACCGSIVIAPEHTLADTAPAQAAIAAARMGNSLVSGVNFNLTYDGQNVNVAVAAGSFPSAADLAHHIQAAIDQAVVTEGVGAPGDVAAIVGDSDAILITQRFSGMAAAEAAIAAARAGDSLISDVMFDLFHNGQAVPVVIDAGSFPTVEALLAHIQAAIDQALIDAGVGEIGYILVGC